MFSFFFFEKSQRGESATKHGDPAVHGHRRAGAGAPAELLLKGAPGTDLLARQDGLRAASDAVPSLIERGREREREREERTETDNREREREVRSLT